MEPKALYPFLSNIAGHTDAAFQIPAIAEDMPAILHITEGDGVIVRYGNITATCMDANKPGRIQLYLFDILVYDSTVTVGKVVNINGLVFSRWTLDNCTAFFNGKQYTEGGVTLVMENSGNKRVTFASDGPFSVAWGDGTTEDFDSETASHDYTDEGPYFITITGTPPNIYEIGESGGLLRRIKGLPVSVENVDVNVPYDKEAKIDLSSLTGLRSLNLNNEGVPATIILPDSQVIDSINVTDGHHTSDTINYILAKLVAAGTNNGNANLSGHTPPAPPTEQGVDDKQTLINRGWTVTTD